jgi:tetratricopeptide (TPR) repeat protein
MNRAAALMALGRCDAALKDLDTVLALDPANSGAWCNRGCILLNLKRLEEALACFDKALARNPDILEALVNRGITLAELKRFQEAALTYEKVVRLNPDMAYARGYLAYYRLPDARDLGDALTQAAEMLMLFADEGIVDLSSAMDFRARFAPDVPVLIVRDQLDEDVIAQALALGAQDAVTLSNVPRLQLVVGRELRTYRLDRALSSTLASAREYKKQLEHIVEGSTDAIAQVQEGIIVDANPAWLALFGYSTAEEVVGTPLMDAFDPDDHAAIKGALTRPAAPALRARSRRRRSAPGCRSARRRRGAGPICGY